MFSDVLIFVFCRTLRMLSAFSKRPRQLQGTPGSNGWRNNLVYTVPSWIHWIFLADFEFYMAVFGVPEGSHWIQSTFKFQMAWCSARFVEYGSSSDRCSWFSGFSEKSGRLPDTVFVVFSGRGFQISIFEVFGRNQKEPRRKVMQIRGGIISRSAFFGRFVPI